MILRPALNTLNGQLQRPLLRNAYALILNDGATAAFGFLYWLAAARLYRADQVGLASALIAAMMMLASIAQVRMEGVMFRFLPQAGARSGRLLTTAYGLNLGLSAAASLIFIFGFARWSTVAASLRQTPILAGLFVLSTMAWTIFSTQDAVLIGMRQAQYVPIENGLFGAVKLILLVAFAGQLASEGIFASWMIPAAAALIPVNTLIVKRLLPRHASASVDRLPPVRQMARYVAADYIALLLSMLSYTALPVIVVEIAGATENAYFYLAWTIASAILFAGRNMALSLTVEGATDEPLLREHAWEAARQSLRLVIPLVIALQLLAPELLRILGSAYAAGGSDVLRLLALAAIPDIAIELTVSIAQVRRRMAMVVLLRGTVCVLSLGLTSLLLPRVGIDGVGIAWLASQSVAAVIALTQLVPFLRGRGA
ncbi:MAG: hypothetical protein JO247_17715 [Chloroflexi bacterium]|nr:hypothetical protein [Chloroflexota bacterium]